MTIELTAATATSMTTITSSTWFARSACGSDSRALPNRQPSRLARQHGDDPADCDGDAGDAQRTRRGRRAITRRPRSRGSAALSRTDRQPRTPWSAGGVGQGVDGAGAGGANGGNEAADRDPQGHARDHADRGQGHRRCTSAAEEAGPRVAEQRSGQPSDGEPSRRGEQGEDHVLGERHAATRPGVAPTALSSPTRRVWSAIRPPTRTATPATASRVSSVLNSPGPPARPARTRRTCRGCPATTAEPACPSWSRCPRRRTIDV